MSNTYDKNYLLQTLNETTADIEALKAWSIMNAGIKRQEIAEFENIFAELNHQLQEVLEKLKD